MIVYGDVLTAFPELLQNLHFWEGVPEVGGGYKIGQEVEVSGILLNTASGQHFMSKDYGGGLALDIENEDLLWVQYDAPVRLGLFFHHPYDGTVHRVVKQWDRNQAGGYKRFVTERVNGSNGLNEQYVPVSGGQYL